jgi:hypothetical protein
LRNEASASGQTSPGSGPLPYKIAALREAHQEALNGLPISQERFPVRMEGVRPVRLTVAEMTPDEARLAVAFAERELVLTLENATPALALLQRVAEGDRSMTRREVRKARETVATLVRMRQQTDRLRAAVQAVRPVAD